MKQKLRMRRGISTARKSLKLLASLKSEARLTQEGDVVFPDGNRQLIADRILARDKIIQQITEAAQMALAQAEKEG